MQLHAEKKRKKPVQQNSGLYGYLFPQKRRLDRASPKLGFIPDFGTKQSGKDRKPKSLNFRDNRAKPDPEPQKPRQKQESPGLAMNLRDKPDDPELPDSSQPEQDLSPHEQLANMGVLDMDQLQQGVLDQGLVPYPDPSRPDDSPFKQAEERYQKAIDASSQMAKAGALAQTFSAIADAATMLTKGRSGPVAVGHDRTGAQLSHDALNRMQEEDRHFQGGLQEHFNRLFQHQQQRDQIKQANVQLLNEAIISDTQQTITDLREALQAQGHEVPDNIRQAEHFINLALRAAGTKSGNRLATHYMEQAQKLGAFDEELNLNPEFFDVPMQPQGGGGGPAPGFTEDGEIDPDGPQAFDLMQAEVNISDFQSARQELQAVERKIEQEREKEVPDEGVLGRLEDRKSNLESRITSLRDNEYVQRWDVQNRYSQLQQERRGDLREQQFEFMHGQRGIFSSTFKRHHLKA